MDTSIEVVRVEFVLENAVNLTLRKTIIQDSGESEYKYWLSPTLFGGDLDKPLSCQWDGDTEIVPVLIAEDVKAAILAKWAELEA